MKNCLYPIAIVCISAFFWSACGTNVYQGFAGPSSDKDYLEQARIHINNGKYDAAAKYLAKVKNHNREYILLDVSARLGNANFTLWGILSNIVENMTSGESSSSGGQSTVFAYLSDSLFGTGEDRTAALTAINSSVLSLSEISDKDATSEALRCFLTGIMVLPTVNDGTEGITEAVNSLDQLQNSVTGSGSTADECPGIDDFERAMATVSRVQSDLDYVLAQTSSCPILSFLNNSDALNDVQARLKKFISAADKGCTDPCASATDPKVANACQALQLGCVQTVLNDDTAVAGDGKVSRCELVMNCMGGGCF